MNMEIRCPESVLADLTPTQREVYQRLNRHEFDRPDSPLPFSRRLQKENQWSRDFADRAIREYKRFAFLAVVAGHPVSPSDQVDQVWHLHLTYTRSYWQEFCDAILGTPLHHEPTKGGTNERAKHDDWYRNTLESYERIFGQVPPADLWPASEIRFGRDNHFARFNTQQNWIIPKPQWLQAKAQLPKAPQLNLRALNLRGLVTICLGLGLSSLLASCQADGNTFNPLNMRGPEFLGFYLFLNMIVVGVGLVLRQMLKPVANANAYSTPTLDAYEMAYLAGGADRLIQTVITRLAEQKHIELDASQQLQVATPLPTGAAAIEQDLLNAIDGSSRFTALKTQLKSLASISQYHDRLIQQGLLVDQSQTSKMQLYPALLLAMSLALGVMKMLVGISRDRPVGFLFFICGALTIALVLFLVIKPHRTKNGDQLLAKLTQAMRAEKKINRNAEVDLTQNVALFGGAVLAGSSLVAFHHYFTPPSSSSSGCSSDGSGCGSSCSSGCGGACGGGCGGCGS